MELADIQVRTLNSTEEIQGILDLQGINLASAITPEELADQGFVTVRHDYSTLERMNARYPSVVAKAGDQVVGYALMMSQEFGGDIPVLRPMFQMIDEQTWRGKPLKGDPGWFVMGQVCIAKGYRGIGLFERMYDELKKAYQSDFHLIITEVAERNQRSLRAHMRIGFELVHRFIDSQNGEDWHLIGWEI